MNHSQHPARRAGLFNPRRTAPGYFYDAPSGLSIAVLNSHLKFAEAAGQRADRRLGQVRERAGTRHEAEARGDHLPDA